MANIHVPEYSRRCREGRFVPWRNIPLVHELHCWPVLRSRHARRPERVAQLRLDVVHPTPFEYARVHEKQRQIAWEECCVSHHHLLDGGSERFRRGCEESVDPPKRHKEERSMCCEAYGSHTCDARPVKVVGFLFLDETLARDVADGVCARACEARRQEGASESPSSLRVVSCRRQRCVFLQSRNRRRCASRPRELGEHARQQG
mmetsp:Transcript_12461/g.31255  ORF Transcript_12461/g.31255 Transcript_12461/m.31255 type:complete len:204 (-) Transcript_12461:79-690(-)